MKAYLKFVGILYGSFVLGVVIFDTANFISAYQSDYETPWFNSSFLHEPIANIALPLFGRKTADHWEFNAEGSENWHIVEYTFGKKTFWTVLERKSLGDK
jgi:hypothetical protein